MVADVALGVGGSPISEHIPDSDLLYMRAHKTWFNKKGQLTPGVFQNRGEGPSAGMSTNWSKYATAEETRNAHREPAKNAVIALVTGDVRRLPGQTVQHTPQPNNYAHTDVFGEKTEEVRVRLLRMCTFVLDMNDLGA